MNRICAAFSDIGNINLHNADVPPFNYEMFLSEPCTDLNPDACQLFCEMDEINKSCVIESKDFDYASERESKSKYELLAHMIEEEMVSQFGELKESYPYIVKFLFADKAVDKAIHKQMFWRVYGDIALENIKKNIETHKTCDKCGMKYPSWVEHHNCMSDMTGYDTCIDCGKKFQKKNSSQQRCEMCQEVYRRTSEASRKKNKYKQMKEAKEKYTTSLVSRLKTT